MAVQQPTDRPQPPDLPAFLLARIAEDEAAAVEAGGDDWRVADERKVRWHRGHAQGWVAFADLPTATAHIARHDPARVLAECEAKRRIVEDYRTAHAEAARFGESFDLGWEYGTELALKFLALPYADHPDYRAEWRP